MLNKHTLRKVCLIAALALGTMLTVNAQQWKNYGVHEHSHPVSDAKAHEFMSKYFGWRPTTTDGTDYEHKTYNHIAPTDVEDDEMIIVEVNPYWRGTSQYKGSSKLYYHLVNNEAVGAPLWNYAKFGIKDVKKVGKPNKTANGKLYSYTGHLGRFFFAKKRKTAYLPTGAFPGDVYKILGVWYDEWSLLTPGSDANSIGWDNFASKDHYNDFVQGAVWYAPHNCSNSLDMNHFTSFIKEGTEDTFDGYTATMLLYVSDHWDTNDSKGKGNVPQGAHMPFMCMLQAKQDPTQVNPVEGEKEKYDITITFSSTFSEARVIAEKDSEYMWIKDQTAGVREFFEIYRDGTKIAEVPADQLTYDSQTKKYTWTDTNGNEHFTSSETEVLGTDYKYDIVSKLYNVDANGIKIDGSSTIATAETNKQTAHIPGQESLSLEMDGATKCKYTPSTTLNGGYNTFTHILNSGVKKPYHYKNGDILELRQSIDGAAYTVVDGYQQTLEGEGEISDIIASAPWKQMTKEFQKQGGEILADTKYQLVLKHYDGEKWVEAFSNEVTLSSNHVVLSSGSYAHRQGHPSAAFCPSDEVYHNEVKFTPNHDDILYYVIVCNGDPKEVYVITPGMYTKGEEYPLAVQHTSSSINPKEEEGTTSSKEIFYTCVVFTTDGSSYGSADLPFTFKGTPDELVFYNDPEFGATDRTRNSHHESAWQGEFDIKLLEGAGANASDVDPSKITGAKIYGIFYPTKQDYEAKTNAVEKELCTVDPADIGLNYTYRTEVYVKGNPKYAEEWATLEELYKTYDYQSEQVKPTWTAICEKMWFDNMPADIYVGVTFEGTSTPALAAAKAVNRALDKDNTYTKYTNWAQLPPPDFSNPIITGIETIDADASAAVYPNPATDEISFYAQGTVDIYNLAGARVMTLTANGKTTVDISVLPAGTYILRTGREAYRFIVTK
ncbi:MAG: T9SS type A sorting domain-containing protein [Muribaculaceae bacterium]|nr:T9SS type A sorting domain-containing protein [Muribaculaceae bacterium]